MANFGFTNLLGTSPTSMTSTPKTQASITAATATLTQGCLIDVSFGQNGAPSTTDGDVVWQIAKCTSAGTAGSTFVAVPTQPGWRASGNVVGVNHSADPTGFNTITNLLYSIAINQRASYRWMPVPGSELYWPATNATGLCIPASSPVASSYSSTVIVSGTYQE
jgi:hypothetical protein